MSHECETVKVAVNEPHRYKIINKSDLNTSHVLYVDEIKTDLSEELAVKRGRPKKPIEAE